MVGLSGKRVSDALWARIGPQLAHPTQPARSSAPAGASRKPSDLRVIFDGVVHVLRTGIPWSALPRSYGSATTAHRRFHSWLKAGIFAKLWEAGIKEFKDLETIARERSKTGPDLHPTSKLFRGARIETGRIESPHAEARAELSIQAIRERTPSLYEPRIQSLVLRLHAATTARAFWGSMQSLFQETVPNDAMIAYIDYLDHPTSWQASKILATPNAKMPPEWFAQKWRVEPTPRFITEHPRIKLYRFSDMFSDPRESCKTELFKRFMKPYGWHHIVTSLYWDGTQPRSGISLRRTRQQGDFQPAEMDLLRSLHPHIETAINRVLEMQDERAKRNWLETFNFRLPFAVLLLNWELKLSYANQKAMEECAVWNLGPAARAFHSKAVFRIPPAVLAACEELRAQWLQQTQKCAPQRRVSIFAKLPHQGDLTRTVTITLQTENQGAISRPGFVVHFEELLAARPAIDRESANAILFRLTGSEREIVRLVVDGHSNEEIASCLHKSVNTVKNQLTVIFRKLEVTSRSRLIVLFR